MTRQDPEMAEGFRALTRAIEALTDEVRLLRQAIAQRPAAGVSAPGPAAAALPAAPPSRVPAGSAMATIEANIAALMAAARVEDEEAGFERFRALVLPQRQDSPRAVYSLRGSVWRALRQSVGRYLDPEGAFEIVSTAPAELREDTGVIKVFLRKAGGSPSPVTFERDPGGAWWMRDFGL